MLSCFYCLFLSGEIGSFLVRDSESKQGELSLSVREARGVIHYRICTTDNGKGAVLALYRSLLLLSICCCLCCRLSLSLSLSLSPPPPTPLFVAIPLFPPLSIRCCYICCCLCVSVTFCHPFFSFLDIYMFVDVQKREIWMKDTLHILCVCMFLYGHR